jgi:site-specific DNA recombinase
MTSTNCCAIYARVSTDKQSPLSPLDQIQKCKDFALELGMESREEFVFIDDAMSGSGADRPSFQRLLSIAHAPRCPFQVILAEDTSRLSRNLSDAIGTIERLKFAGIRVIFVSQGIDTNDEQSDVQVAVHGLVDSLYVKELGKKTHRGLEGRVLRGLHVGGRCFGYTAVKSGEDGSKKLVINEREASVVRRMYELSANGSSLKKITGLLNAESVPPPRKRVGRSGQWCPSAVRAMLRRELYKGEVIWNRSKFEKVPRTNKRVRRPRPQSQWKRVSNPALKIVEPEVWTRVQARLDPLNQYGNGLNSSGLMHRSLTSPYLFSGLLKCGQCGGNLIIGTGGGSHRHPKYVCANYYNRQTCKNNLYIRHDDLETRLLTGLQSELLRAEAIDYAVDSLTKMLKASDRNLINEIEPLRTRQAILQNEIRNLSRAIAEHGHSPQLLRELTARERECAANEERLNQRPTTPADLDSDQVRRLFIESGQLRPKFCGADGKLTTRLYLLIHKSDRRLFLIEKGVEAEVMFVRTWLSNSLLHLCSAPRMVRASTGQIQGREEDLPKLPDHAIASSGKSLPVRGLWLETTR